ncbi:ribosomal RNA large subunit methyltransferase E [Rickettsiales bacterium]|nr:ribosomal RNA large subunit methyltransferase E [Rickettsiales bacterium]
MKIRVKTAKGRPPSSTSWLRRHLNDRYAKCAAIEGYRSRSAYKLLQIDEKFELLKSGHAAIDLGSAPGGWSQVAAAKVGRHGRVIAVDTACMHPIDNVDFINRSFLEAKNLIEDSLRDKPADVVLSDMAPFSCGDAYTDHIRLMNLCEEAADFACQVLTRGGCFVCKMLRGGTEQELYDNLKRHFNKVKYFKPAASHPSSAEIYMVAMGFVG